MKCLILILFPVCAFTQPKKAVLYSKKTGYAISDSIMVWKGEEAVQGKLFIGEKIITIGTEQYSIDSFTAITEQEKKIFTYFLSLRGKKVRCFVYPAEAAKEWGLLLDTPSTMTLYKVRE
ncbi:MAG: hypothetical protein M3Q06_12855 [Bacteroidota bacterium]|nr:hypothetical protein [Bacteroidota bacterium]